MPTRAPLEKATQKAIKAALEARGCYVAKVPGSQYGQGGIPDLLVCYRGWFIGMEVKRENWVESDVSALQRRELTKIGLADGLGCVVGSVRAAMLIIDAMQEAIGKTPKPKIVDTLKGPK